MACIFDKWAFGWMNLFFGIVSVAPVATFSMALTAVATLSHLACMSSHHCNVAGNTFQLKCWEQPLLSGIMLEWAQAGVMPQMMEM